MPKIIGDLMSESKPRALGLWFKAFFIYFRGEYTIFAPPVAESAVLLPRSMCKTAPLNPVVQKNYFTIQNRAFMDMAMEWKMIII